MGLNTTEERQTSNKSNGTLPSPEEKGMEIQWIKQEHSVMFKKSQQNKFSTETV